VSGGRRPPAGHQAIEAVLAPALAVEAAGDGLTASFGYDALGRRRTKTVNATQTDALYDGLNPVQEGVLPGLGLDEFFTRTDAAGLRAFLTDSLGSSLTLADGVGTVQTEYTYAPFGETSTSGQASTNAHQFTGPENDGTGLYSYRARYYHPTLGRFMTEEPWGCPVAPGRRPSPQHQKCWSLPRPPSRAPCSRAGGGCVLRCRRASAHPFL
jgi:RHS repeat-associated protein